MLQGISDVELEVDRNFARALISMQQSLALREAIIASPKTNAAGLGLQAPAIGQTALAEALAHVGTFYLRAGQLDLALPYYQRAFALREQLQRQSPKDVAARLDLLRAHLSLGEIASLPEGRTHFEAATRIADDVRAASPSDPTVAIDVYGAHKAYGEALLRARALRQARQQLQVADEVTRTAVERFPTDATVQQDRAWALHTLGELERLDGHPRAAAAVFNAEVVIWRRLSEADPQNVAHRVELAIALAGTTACADAAGVLDGLPRDVKPDLELLLGQAQVYGQCATQPGNYRDLAVDAIRRAIAAGYRDASYIEQQPDFDALRGDPRVREALAGIPAAAAAAR